MAELSRIERKLCGRNAAGRTLALGLAVAGLFSVSPARLRAEDASSPAAPTAMAAAAPAGDAVVYDLIAQRLDVAHDVAWNKFNRNAPVYDAQREAVTLQSLMLKATQSGLPPRVATAFFTAQIAASRQVQNELIAAWKGGALKPASAFLDLDKDIRPRVDVLNQKLLAVLAAHPDWLTDRARVEVAQARLQALGYSAAAAKLAAQGLFVSK